MNFFQKHSLVHYIFHSAIAVFLLMLLVFSENIFPNSLSYESNLVFGERTISIEGEVYKKLSFETKKITKNSGFFEGDSFSSFAGAGIDLSFSDFTVLRSGENTNFSVGTSTHPEISLHNGTLWLSTKEYVVTYLPQAKVETLAGSALVQRTTEGKTRIIAWNKPSRVTFLDTENTPLWSFLLPSRHQVEFSPQDFFSLEEFEQIRFSKLKKEFPIKKVSATDFILENIRKDSNWEFRVIKQIEDRKNVFFGTSLQSSLFSFSPNKQNEEQGAVVREEVMNIWSVLHKKQFRSFEQSIKGLSEERKKNFYKYAGFFPHNDFSTDVFVKSFPRSVGRLWKELWTLESLIASGLDTKFQQDRLRKSIIKEAIESDYDPEEIQFFAVSLFKNYAKTISYAIIDFFYDANENLINSEGSAQAKLTRKLEIVNDVFSFTQDLIQRKEYLLARKLLDKVETYIQDDSSPLLAAKKAKILQQKEYIRGQVEYAEILGDEDQKHLTSYLSIKKNAEENLENFNLHSAPLEEYPLSKAQNLFEEYGFSFETLSQERDQKRFFSFYEEKNRNGVLFSGTFDLKTEKFSRVIVYEKNGKKERQELYGYIFSLSEISEIDFDILETLFAQSNAPREAIEDTEAIPSEIADLVHSLTQDAFIENDVMINSYELAVVEINTAKITGAIAHYSLLERKKLRERRKRGVKGNDDYELRTEYAYIEEFTFDCFYNVETKQVFNITASAYDQKILLAGSMTIEEMIESLDEKSKKIREKIELKEQSVLHLKSIGVEAKADNIQWKDANTLEIKGMKERTTGVEFDGIYRPFSQKFSEITFLNISKNPVLLKKTISLEDLEEDFQKQKDLLLEKVQRIKRIKGE